jgi:hypothetical protein
VAAFAWRVSTITLDVIALLLCELAFLAGRTHPDDISNGVPLAGLTTFGAYHLHLVHVGCERRRAQSQAQKQNQEASQYEHYAYSLIHPFSPPF